nr:hypothetical protein [Geobacter sp.]
MRYGFSEVQFDSLVRKKPDGPAGATFRGVGTGQGDQLRFKDPIKRDFTWRLFSCLAIKRCIKLRNPIFLDRVSGFDWTMIPILSGQSFSLFLPAVVAC